ncbi:MAG: PH domain-containing protein [Candidatus Saccharibacteria bacterium]
MNPGYTLDDKETIIREVSRHWIDLIPVSISSFVSLLVAIGVSYLSARYNDELSFIPAGILPIISLVFALLSISILTVGYYIYRQNKLIITDMHLIQVVQRGLFSRSVSQLSMVRVQDVSAVRKGFFATILDYGTIEVETAGEVDNFVFNVAPHPQQLADQCLAVQEKYGPHSETETHPV